MTTFIDVVFDGPPGPEAGRFVEVEDASGKSVKFGEWVHQEDGYWALRFPSSQPEPSGELEALPWLVQYRGLNGNSPGDWTTMAAFDQEGPAENYARECGGETRPWEYRALRASGGKEG